jgi:hypothetical protein
MPIQFIVHIKTWSENMELKLSEEQVDEIVIKDLKSLLQFYTQEKNFEMIENILPILQVYMLASDFEDIRKNYGLPEVEPNRIVIDEIIDQDDGSALMNFRVSDSVKNSLMSEGFKYLLIKTVLGNPTDDEIVDKLTNMMLNREGTQSV